MSQAMHLVANNVHDYRVPEARCIPYLGVSGRTAAVYSCSSQVRYRIHSHVKISGIKCASISASFVCEARRNPDFSRHSKLGFARSRNWHNEGRDSFKNSEEDMLSSKNSPLISLSSAPKLRTTAAPGPREKEIVELFKKVQARLRERAAIKAEKKVEASQGQGKEDSTVDSLLKLLRKHSVEQGKRNSESGREKHFSLDQLQDSSQYNGGQSTKLSDLGNAPKDESQGANISVVRPPSNFQRRSPVPHLKYQPVSYDGNDVNTVLLSSGVTKKGQDQIDLKLDPVPEPDFEPELDPKDEGEGGQQIVEHEDLSVLKLPELRALARSQGLKGFSKMKKGELMKLLTGS